MLTAIGKKIHCAYLLYVSARGLQKHGHVQWEIENVTLAGDVATAEYNGTMNCICMFSKSCIERSVTMESLSRLYLEDGDFVLFFDDEI